MKLVKLPPVTKGIDMLSDETSIPAGAVRQAVNVELNRAGGFRRRKGQTAVQRGTGFHSLFAALQKGQLYCAQDTSLKSLSADGTNSTTVFALKTADPLEWSEHNGNVFFSSNSTAGWIPSGTSAPRALGVPVPSGPTVTTSPAGGLLPGTYMTALSLLDERGEESGLSPWQQIALPNGGGLVFSNLPVTSGATVRVWSSQPDGDVMYLAAEFPAGMGQYLMGSYTPKTRAEHDVVGPMPPGEFCRAFGARLYTAQGDTLRYSLPYKFGATHKSTGFVQFNGAITFIEPVKDGIYVGAGNRVWFLDGQSPSQAKQVLVSTCKAIPHSSQLVPGEHFDQETIKTTDPVAVWLSTSGFVVGAPGGNVVELQADRLRVSPAIKTAQLRFVITDGVKQLVAALSTNPTPAGLASDASTT